MHQRVQRASQGLEPARRGPALRSRLALTSILVLGLMMTGTGATLGVTGLAGGGDSATSEYVAPNNSNGGQVLSENESGGNGNSGDNGGSQNGTGDGGAVGGESQSSGDAQGSGNGSASGQRSATRANEQVSQTGGDELPFTGFVAIPLLLAGVGLLGTGAALRRGTSD